MNANNFDFNLANYNDADLYELFDCNSNAPIGVIQRSKDNILRDIARDKSLSNSDLDAMTRFLDGAFKRLEHNATKHVQPEHTRPLPFSKASHETVDDDLGTRREIIHKPYDILASTSAESLGGGGTGGGRDWHRGKFNQIRQEILDVTVNIDTRFRKNYYNTAATDHHITLNEPIKNVVEMNLQAMELPTQIYTVSEKNHSNKFYITDPSNNWKLVTIPSGNYTVHGIANIVSTYIALSTSSTDVIATTTPSLTINPNEPSQGHIIFRSISSSTFKLRFALDDLGIERAPMLNLGWLLGYRMSDYEGNSQYVGEAIYDERAIRYLYLSIDVFNGNYSENVVCNFPESKLGKDVLARIQLKTDNYTVGLRAQDIATSNRRVFFGPVTIEKIHVKLLDEYGRVVDTNNMDFSIAIGFKTIYS